MTENLIARNVREQLWLVNTRCETGRRHQGNGDDKLAAIDTLGCYFGEGAGIENVGRKISRDKGYSRKHTLGRRGDEDKEKAKRGALAQRLLLDDCVQRLYIPSVCRY